MYKGIQNDYKRGKTTADKRDFKKTNTTTKGHKATTKGPTLTTKGHKATTKGIKVNTNWPTEKRTKKDFKKAITNTN